MCGCRLSGATFATKASTIRLLASFVMLIEFCTAARIPGGALFIHSSSVNGLTPAGIDGGRGGLDVVARGRRWDVGGGLRLRVVLQHLQLLVGQGVEDRGVTLPLPARAVGREEGDGGGSVEGRGNLLVVSWVSGRAAVAGLIHVFIGQYAECSIAIIWAPSPRHPRSCWGSGLLYASSPASRWALSGRPRDRPSTRSG